MNLVNTSLTEISSRWRFVLLSVTLLLLTGCAEDVATTDSANLQSNEDFKLNSQLEQLTLVEGDEENRTAAVTPRCRRPKLCGGNVDAVVNRLLQDAKNSPGFW